MVCLTMPIGNSLTKLNTGAQLQAFPYPRASKLFMPRLRRLCVRWGPRSPSPKGAQTPNFRPICSGQMAAWIKMSLDMELGLGPGDFVLDRDPAPLPKGWRRGGGRAPKFSAHVYCGQTSGCIKMPLGTKVGVSPGDSVLDGE